MGANFLGLEQVYFLLFGVYLEIPNTEDLFSKAMNWLISFNLSEWV